MENNILWFVLGVVTAGVLGLLVYCVVIAFRTKKRSELNSAEIKDVHTRIDETIRYVDDRWESFMRDYQQNNDEIYKSVDDIKSSMDSRFDRHMDKHHKENSKDAENKPQLLHS